MLKPKLEVGNTLQALRVSFEEERGVIVRLTVAFAVLSALSALLDVAGPAGFALSFGVAILLGAAYNGMMTALLCLPGKSEGFGELWAAIKPVLARLVWVSLISALLIVAGTFALIIPGIVIAVLISVSGQAVVVERLKVLDAFGRSFNLVKDHFWRVLGYLAILFLFSVLMAALALVVALPLAGGIAGALVLTFLTNLLSTPILTVGWAVLYNQLVEIERMAEPEETESHPATEGPDEVEPPEPRF